MCSTEVTQQEELQKNYNSEPVYYCSHCLSLKIRDAGLPDLLYCDDCGSADILSTDIEHWENLYKDKYGFRYLDKNYNKK
jgi:Fe2+ or Zn2+ uptake regulation protein